MRDIHRLPRISLGTLPTPLEEAPRLGAALGLSRLLVKRDDLTGLALGGNKVRKLEYVMADVRAKGADVVITAAGPQSNRARMTAAACRKAGFECILLLAGEYGVKQPVGNLMLDEVFGADVRFIDAPDSYSAEALAEARRIADGLRRAGRTPYLTEVGGLAEPLSDVGYFAGGRELIEQCRAAGVEPGAVLLATGSGGTQAGLVIGAKALSDRCRVIGISVSDPQGPFAEEVLAIARAADEALGLRLGVEPSDVIVLDKYIRDGYGMVDREVAETIRLVFTREGIVLDPVYTAKAMAGLVDLILTGYFKPTDKVVFFHTGGTPALFPNREKIVEFLK